MQYTTQLVYLAINNELIANTQPIKYLPMAYFIEVRQNAASEDNDLDADQVYNILIEQVCPQGP
jgi:hypothetical protein